MAEKAAASSRECKIIVCGAAGRMGRRIIALAREQDGITISAAVEAPGSPALGSDAGVLAGVGPIGIEIVDDYTAVVDSSTVSLDFTAPPASMAHVRAAAAAGAAIIVGTSGLSREQRDEIETLAASMPAIIAANMSRGINVLISLVADAVNRLGAGYDCEIVEIHHNRKKDSPSGTAIALAEAACQAADLNPAEAILPARAGMVGERKEGEIGVFGLRGGDNVGEHTVMLLGAGERLELTHRAASRDCLAAGAIAAARWLAGRPPGLYSMQDVVAGG